MAEKLDCLVIGYNRGSIEGHLELAKAGKEVSAGYQHVLANSARFLGKRGDYFDAINSALTAATGESSELHFGKMPNLAVNILASFLERHDLTADVINYFNGEQDRLIELLKDEPLTVAITTTFYIDNAPIAEIAEFVKKHSPSTKIIVGGPRMFHMFSDYPEKRWPFLLKSIGADMYVFDSQGELTLARTVKELKKAEPDLKRVPNIITGNPLALTSRLPEANEMNSTSVNWAGALKHSDANVVSMRTARSCAFKCSFCRYPLIAGSLDLTDIDVVEKDLRDLHDRGIKYVLFIDDTFNIPQPRFKELCRMIIRNKFDFKWLSYFRCANADDEAFDLAAEAGCIGVFLGIESGDASILRNMNKGARVDRYRDGIRKLNDRGIISYSTFICGFPGETEETIQNTINFIRETGPTYYSMEPYYHDPKVPIAERSEEFGLKGSGYSWKHNTMDWKEATKWSLYAYETITESTVLPLNNFDLWSVGYLLGEGFSKETITSTLEILAKITIAGIREPEMNYTDNENRLINLFKEAPELQTITQATSKTA